MKQMGKWLCLALVLSMACSAFACGRQQEETASADAARPDSTQTVQDEDADADDDEDDADDDKPVDLSRVKVRGSSKTDPKTDSQTDSGTDSKTDSKPDPKTDSKTDAGTNPKSAGSSTASAEGADGAAAEDAGPADTADSAASADAESAGNTAGAGSADNAGNTGSAGNTGNADASGTAGGSENTGSAGNTAEAPDGGSSGNTGNAGDAGSVQENGGQADAGQSVSADSTAQQSADSTAELPADTPDEPGEVTEETGVSGVIDLSAGSFEGEGITFESGHVLITGEGTYILTGSMTGMVEVNTVNKVKLKLSGTDINNPSGPAILCTDAKRLTITLIEGTSNVLTDGAGTAYDGALCSNDTLEIKGAGSLTVNANNAHGISSDDDIIVKNGDITVNAVKSGMMANDDITVSGGTLRVSGGTNGIKSKGSLHISGGSIRTFGGPKETKSALYAGTTFTLTGGSIYAIGCGVTAPDTATSTQAGIAVRVTPSLDAGSSMGLVANDAWLMDETSPYAGNTLFVSTPDIVDGMNCQLYVNGEPCGESFPTSGLVTSAAATR